MLRVIGSNAGERRGRLVGVARVAAGIGLLFLLASGVQAQTTAFTYQGQLKDGTEAANGSYDLSFSLFGQESSGVALAGPVYADDQAVVNGLFTVNPDFGSAELSGGDRWVEVGVRPGSVDNADRTPGTYTVLSPRQRITSVPYSIRSLSAASAAQSSSVVASYRVASGESVSNRRVVSLANGRICDGFDTPWVGSKQLVHSGGLPTFIKVVGLTGAQFVVVYAENSVANAGLSRCGRIVGDSVEWGNEITFNASDTTYLAAAALHPNRLVVAYSDSSNSSYGTVQIGTVADDGTLTWANKQVFHYASTSNISVCPLTHQSFVIAYRDEGDSSRGKSVVGLSNSSFVSSFGPETLLNSDATSNIVLTRISSNKIAVAYRGFNMIGYRTEGAIGLFDGTSIGWGDPVTLESKSLNYLCATTLNEEEVLFGWSDPDLDPPNQPRFHLCSIVGSTLDSLSTHQWGTSTSHNALSALSGNRFIWAAQWDGTTGDGILATRVQRIPGWGDWGGMVVFDEGVSAAGINTISIAPLDGSRFVVAFRDEDSAQAVRVVLGDAGMILGIAQGAGVTGERIPVVTGGISSGHSDLVPGAPYYTTHDGNLTLTAYGPRIGVAISSTELLVDIER